MAISRPKKKRLWISNRHPEPKLCDLVVTGLATQSAKACKYNQLRYWIWLPTLDTLRNFFYAPTVEMKITFEMLRRESLAG
jgi:hypothetical protein